MFNLSKQARHEKLVDGMAERQGIDMAEEIMRGNLTGTALRAAIYSCTHCTRPEECAQWQAEHADGADRSPDYCRNAGLFAQLKGG